MISIIQRFLFSYIPKIPKFLYLKAIDIYRYFKFKDWINFEGFGLHIYVGMFGSGKTISMVEKAYRIAKAFPQVRILTNMKLVGFPEHTEIIQLKNYKQIIDMPGDTLILKMELMSPIRRGIVQMMGTAYVGNKIVSEGELTAQIVRRESNPI